MKVKNVVFSGFMAAILMSATGTASAAISVASQGYVDAQVDAVEASVSNTYLTKDDAADTYLTETQVTEQITSVITAEDGAVATAQAAAEQAQSEVDALEGVVATKANAADVYSKTEADAKFEEQANATKKLQESKDYTDEQIKTLTESLGGVGEDGESTGLTGTVAAQGVRITSLEDKVGTTSVADQIAGALTTAQGYADSAEANAKEYADGLAKNYDAAGSADDALTAAKAYTDELANGQVKTNKESIESINTTLGSMATSETVTALTERVGTAESDIDALQAKDTELAADIATNAQGIADNKSAIEQIEDAYIAKPAACQNTYCVLSVNGETISWMPLTEPVADFMDK